MRRSTRYGMRDEANKTGKYNEITKCHRGIPLKQKTNFSIAAATTESLAVEP